MFLFGTNLQISSSILHFFPRLTFYNNNLYLNRFSHSKSMNGYFSVPLGFVCGYPVSGGELYGGSMFIASAANDTLQGRAIQRVNEHWGADFRSWNGRETIGISVCKKKYGQFFVLFCFSSSFFLLYRFFWFCLE